ncbi:MAG TPA: family 20 glycosylhydrolase [Terriglobales bacterium]|nr:family 20 glycosylhydrolase [Terriglobales bacterium]
MRTPLIATAFLLLASSALAQSQSQLPLMPLPASVQTGTGQLPITASFSVAVSGVHDASLDEEVQRFQTQLSRQTGIPFHPTAGSAPTLEIHAEHGREAVQRLGEDESYELAVTGSVAKLNAPNPLGVIRGLQTFLQLVQITPTGFAAPAVIIKDQPRFPWRGLMFDVSRHFIPLDVLKRNLDAMAAVKMNVMHWHLSDDQGFRVESKKFPKLQEMGSDGLYYTQDEVRDLIAYAHDRGIRVIPEFDMPGHATSWLVGYPELASAPGPYTIGRTIGVYDPVIDPTQERTYKFLEEFIAEMAKLFPDAYFHIGGDEVNGKQWDANPKIQAFKQAHGMKSNQDLQAYFNQRLEKIVAKNHKIMVGWDEVLHPDLPKTIVVQSWRGQASLDAAAKQGYSGLLSYGYYLDLMWPASRHYAVDPLAQTTTDPAAALTPEEKSRILGGEACMWAEWVMPENVDSHIWPRNAAIAERLWSRQDVTDVDSMYARLNAVSLDLEWLGLTHRSARQHMLHRMAGSADISSLRVLADVVEPVKDYNREDATKGPIDLQAPLTSLVDAVYPESDTARQFASLVQRFNQSGYKDQATEAQIRHCLTLWRDNDSKLQPLLTQSSLLQEDAPLSQDLSALGAAGLQALDYLDKSQAAPDAWKAQQAVFFAQALKPKANLLLMVAAPIRQLVEANSGAETHN